MRIVFLTFLFCSVYAESWSVVYCAKGITLHKNELRNIYLKRLRTKQGVNIIALNLPYAHTARKAFMSQVLHVSEWEWSSYYDEMHFMGIKPPQVLRSEQAVTHFVKKVEVAVGYIPTALISDDYIEIARFEP